jgi:hypothetical protein
MKKDCELATVLSHPWRTNRHCFCGYKCGLSNLYLLGLGHDDSS